MSSSDSIQRIRQELHLLSEYLNAAPTVEWPFLLVHAELLLGFVLDGASEADASRTKAA